MQKGIHPVYREADSSLCLREFVQDTDHHR